MIEYAKKEFPTGGFFQVFGLQKPLKG